MTDRIKSFTVVLERDMRTDDVEPILNAIRQVRGVISVTPEVADVADWTARERVRQELSTKILAILRYQNE